MLLTDGAGDLADLPPFSPSAVFTEWGIDPLLFVVTVWVAGLYLYGVWVLRSRGDSWPLGRTLSFVVLGIGSFYFATSSGLAAYDTVLLSAHMVQHMILSMLVPLCLALGAPVTLMLRTLPKRPRGWLLKLLHSRVAKVLTFPPLTFLLFVVSPWALYFSGWYDATLHSTFLHEMMHVHLVLVGSLFFWPMV
ncbi:MAG: cytochrome c oxidase assembly protein, partial [Nocardioidaceae bacterium]